MTDPKATADPQMVCSECLGRYKDGKPQCLCSGDTTFKVMVVASVLFVLGLVLLVPVAIGVAIGLRR